MYEGMLPTSASTPSDVAVRSMAFAPASVAAPATHSTREAYIGLAGNSTPIGEALRRRIIADITHADAALASLLDRCPVRRLDGDAQARLAVSVAGDRDLLAGLADGAHVATTWAGLPAIVSQVRRSRPVADSFGAGHLQDLAALCQVAEANTTRLASLDEVVVKTEGSAGLIAVRRELATARLLNSEADLAATAARDAALMLSASSTRKEILAVTGQVLRLDIQLDRVDQILTFVELGLEVREGGVTSGAPSRDPEGFVEVLG
ncbi:hypothetical protein DDE18_16860 [Nocardioides gansuensis]|uniref:Uncharacterized protein n=1 Tax=Nocardioides gansuensis TaxID=2138300 RepID=A0A2T8F7I0_9ACTN|nr:hypothetical protein [Nocardioides gansuensis]PVG81660.1 hypothetical protein DDE18_16860 [Nocardioides gansuensis]